MLLRGVWKTSRCVRSSDHDEVVFEEWEPVEQVWDDWFEFSAVVSSFAVVFEHSIGDVDGVEADFFEECDDFVAAVFSDVSHVAEFLEFLVFFVGVGVDAFLGEEEGVEIGV